MRHVDVMTDSMRCVCSVCSRYMSMSLCPGYLHDIIYLLAPTPTTPHPRLTTVRAVLQFWQVMARYMLTNDVVVTMVRQMREWIVQTMSALTEQVSEA